MLKIILKNKKKLKEKGFTLVELLAVIVILAIIMLIAIPAVLSTMESAKRKTFAEYVDKASGLSQKQLAEDQMIGTKSSTGCYVYNVKTQLGLSNTGDYDGWVLINPIDNDIYVTLFNDEYVLIGYHYSDSSLKIENNVQARTEANERELTVEKLCASSSCTTCEAKDGTIDNEEYKERNSAILDTGRNVNIKIRSLYGASSNVNYYFNNIKSFERSNTLSDVENKVDISSSESGYKIWAWNDGDKVYYYCNAPGYVYMNEDSSYMFANWSVVNLDVSGLNTSKVKKMNYMFWAIRSETLNLSSFDTSKVDNMNHMFYNSTSLKTLDLKNFNTSRVNDMAYMFSFCRRLKSIDVSTWKTPSLEYINDMFYYAGIENINLSSFDTSSVKNMSGLFSSCSSLIEADIAGFVIDNVTDISYMFNQCFKLKSVDVSKWNTSNVETMLYIFTQCYELQTIDVSGWDTSKVKNFNSIFESCRNVKVLDVSKWKTSKVTMMSKVFYNCQKVENLNLSGWDTSNVTSMSGMFAHCYGLTKLDLSSFRTSSLHTMEDMFNYCKNLKEVNLSSFDTSGVYVFMSMFESCQSIEIIDISNFNTSLATRMQSMFQSCYKLKTIYVGASWNADGVTYTDEMFDKCTNIVGSNGTVTYDSSKTDKTMANYTTGYLTLKV